MRHEQTIHGMQHVIEGIDKLINEPEAQKRIKSNEFDIAAFSWCDPSSDQPPVKHLKKPTHNAHCRNLLLFPQGSVATRQPLPSMSIFLQLADSKYLPTADLPEANFTLTVINRTNPESSISKGIAFLSLPCGLRMGCR